MINVVDDLNRGDLVAIAGSYRSRLFPAFFEKNTSKSIHYWRVYDWSGDFKDYKLRYSETNNIDDYLEHFLNEHGLPGKSYIHGRAYKNRIVPITEDVLNKGQKKYYNKLKEKLNL